MLLRDAIGLGLARRRLRDASHGRATVLGRALEAAQVRENADGTYDLIGVEILSTGGPIHGIGSPPEGDFWTLTELRDMAEADLELGDELVPPNKIGHPDEQALVRNSIAAGELELVAPADGEMPAVGWLEDLRVDGQKLLADIRKVPRIVYELIEKGAYRTRSVELSKVTSQRTGKTYEWVVTGLAWLGGKMPAVRTLGDVAALYEGDVPIRRIFVDARALEVGDVIWNPERSLMDLRSDLQEALNGPTVAGIIEPRWYVRDVSLDLTAIVEDWTSDGDAYLVSFTIGDDQEPVPAPFDEWTPAQPTWIEAARENAARTTELGFLTLRERSSDTGATMRYSAEQIRKFATATGLKADDVTAKMLEDAGVKPEGAADEETTPAGTEPDEAEPGTNEGGMTDVGTDPQKTEEERKNAALGSRVLALETELHQERRRAFVDGVIRSGKIAPGQRESLETLYDRDADAARKFVDELKPREDLLSELGDDDEDGRELEASGGRSYEDAASDRLGIPKEDLV